MYDQETNAAEVQLIKIAFVNFREITSTANNIPARELPKRVSDPGRNSRADQFSFIGRCNFAVAMCRISQSRSSHNGGNLNPGGAAKDHGEETVEVMGRDLVRGQLIFPAPDGLKDLLDPFVLLSFEQEFSRKEDQANPDRQGKSGTILANPGGSRGIPLPQQR